MTRILLATGFAVIALAVAGGASSRGSDLATAYRGVPDDLPVFTASGSVKTTIAPKEIVVGVVASPPAVLAPSPTPPAFFAGVKKELVDGGVVVKSAAIEPDSLAWYVPLVTDRGAFRFPGLRQPTLSQPKTWRVLFTVESSQAQLTEINNALDGIRRRFGTQINRITMQVVFDLSYEANRAAWNAAEDNAQPQADELAQITHGGKLDPAKTTLVVSSVYPENPHDAHYDPAGPVYDKITTLTPLVADLRVRMRYIGTQPARFEVLPAVAVQAKAAVRSASPAYGFMLPEQTAAPAVEMAADRPELFVAGGASIQASLEAGLAPYAVALLSARGRARDLASILGVRLGRESLFALYNDHEIGVATTFSGDYIPSAQEGVIDSTVRVFHYKDIPSGMAIQIAIPRSESTLTERTLVRIFQPSNELQFDIEADSNTASLPDPEGLAAKMRALPGVIDAAVSSPNSNSRVRFKVLLPRSGRSVLLPKLTGLVGSTYAPFNPTLSFDIEFVPDCVAADRRGLQIAFRQDRLAAEGDARAAHLRLRRLLLVSASGLEEEACYPLARDPSYLAYSSFDKVPESPKPVQLSADAIMVYRTAPL